MMDKEIKERIKRHQEFFKTHEQCLKVYMRVFFMLPEEKLKELLFGSPEDWSSLKRAKES